MSALDLSQFHLVFSDSFSSLSLRDHAHPHGTWTTHFFYGDRFLPANGELEFYIDPNYNNLGLSPFSLKDGVLTIKAWPKPDNVKVNGQYLSGLLTTQHSFSQTYGYFEIKARLPAGRGLWPAFWLLPANGQWPPEIDVMEMLGDQPRDIYVSLHVQDKSHTQVTKIHTFDSSTGFHTYGVDWEPQTITFYMDGVEVHKTITPPEFNRPMYMLINLAVGGHWPKNPDSETAFPARMRIDYVRAYASESTVLGAQVTRYSQ